MQNPFQNLLIFSLILILPACVTTRAELNERGSQQESPVASSSVKSESIHASDSTASPNANVRPPRALAQTANPPSQASSTVSTPVSPSMANQGDYQSDELKAEVAQLTGKVEELERDKQLRENVHVEETKRLQVKIEELEKKLKATEGPAIPEGKDAFEAGKDAYFAGHYAEAVEFLDSWLKNDNAKNAEEATYLRGESQFKLKNYKKAIVDFSTFPEKYQKSSYHPKALLRISESFEEMGRKEDAKAFYSDLAEKFPKTAEGKIAKKRLSNKK